MSQSTIPLAEVEQVKITLLIDNAVDVLMAGTEIFRPLRDLRGVLHQGMNGQAAANGIHALLDTPVVAPARRARMPGSRLGTGNAGPAGIRVPGRPGSGIR